jgi:hypothetical protein
VGLFRRLGAQGGDGAVVDDVPAKAEGEVNLEWKAVRMAGRRNRADEPPMASFAPDALDEIDRAGSLAQFGYVMGPAE